MSKEDATHTARKPFGRVALLFVLLFFLLGLVTGCGDTPEERAVEDAVNGFVQAVADDDGERACLMLSREAQAWLIRTQGGPSCERAAERLPDLDATDSYDFGASASHPMRGRPVSRQA